MDTQVIEAEEWIQKMIELLNQHPEGYRAEHLCAVALNRILMNKRCGVICRIQFLPSVENETPYGI